MVGDLQTGNVAAAFQFHELSHYAADLGLTLDPPSLVAGGPPTSSSLMNAQTTTGPQDSGGKPPQVPPGLEHVVALFNQSIAAGFSDQQQHGVLNTNPLSQVVTNQEQFLAHPHHG